MKLLVDRVKTYIALADHSAFSSLSLKKAQCRLSPWSSLSSMVRIKTNQAIDLTIAARRLARLRLLPSPPLEHPPLSLLGFDPVLGHPTLEEFCQLIQKKKGTVKGMIMDQAFSAGVGNWVADECAQTSSCAADIPQNLVPSPNPSCVSCSCADRTRR